MRFVALVACLKSYIHGEMLAGCIFDKGRGFRLGDQLKEYGGQVSDCRRCRRVPRLFLEKDTLSFLHPRVVLHQLWVQERILRDDVFYPLDQAVCVEKAEFRREPYSVLISEGIHRGESLDRRNVVLFGISAARHHYRRGPSTRTRDFSWICSSVLGVFLAI